MIGAGYRIIESTAACTYERNRRYAKRRAKSPRHWARMDKKYAKRYGAHAVPAAYILNGDTLIMHPVLAHEHRLAIRQAQNSVQNPQLGNLILGDF